MFLIREGHRCLNQLPANTAPSEIRRHLGVNHDETAVALLVREERHTVVGTHFESLLRRIVAHVHG